MDHRTYIINRFANHPLLSIEVIKDEVILMHNNKDAKNNLNIIFILKDKVIYEIYFNYKQSSIILPFSRCKPRCYDGITSFNVNTGVIESYLNQTIAGWSEKRFSFKGQCYKVEVYFKNASKPLVFRKPYLQNINFYFKLYTNIIFKDLESTVITEPVIKEEEHIIKPISTISQSGE